LRRREAALRNGKRRDGTRVVAAAKRRGYDGVPPRFARGRARLRKAQVVAGYLVVMGGLVLCARNGWLPEGGFLPLDLVLTGTVMAAPIVLDTQLGRAGITNDRLTVYTPTGQRTLDLESLKRVRRLILPTRVSAGIDLLFVTDGRRVHAALTSEAAIAAVGRAVTPQTRVSRLARLRLKPEPTTFLRGAGMVVEFLVPYALFVVGFMVLATVAYGLAFP
jgi:hypothetical protein